MGVCGIIGHVRHRLNRVQRDEMIRLYREEGWHIVHLARLFNVHHSTVEYWTDDVERTVPPMEFCPPDVLEKSITFSTRRMNSPKFRFTYEEILKRELARMERYRAECEHPNQKLVVICLQCKEHLEETKRHPALVEIIKKEHARQTHIV